MPDEAALASIYPLIGEQGFKRLIATFYRKVPGDDILGPMYPADDLAGSEERLCGFLMFRFGGPDDYVRERGQPQLRMRHAPFTVNQAARDRWVHLMDEALIEAELPAEAT